jgi:regulation of enolase protein 1 (concanavalin A-like superfamily)
MEWLNEPPYWNSKSGIITATTGPETDFWRETHYGFIRDSGHFYYQPVSGDFTAQVSFSGDYDTLYDQAGLMLRLDARTWIKTGIEYVDERQTLSAVVTRDFSDWSLTPLLSRPAGLCLRLSREGTAVRIEYSSNGVHYETLRLAYLPWQETAQVGIMLCSPKREGFTARFEDFEVGALIKPAEKA